MLSQSSEDIIPILLILFLESDFHEVSFITSNASCLYFEKYSTFKFFQPAKFLCSKS